MQTLLSGNLFVSALLLATESPRTLEEVAAALRERLPYCRDASTETIMRLVEAYLLLGSYGDDKEPPLLRPKLHTFFHGVYDVGLCMNPTCRKLATDGSDSCRHCDSAVRPAVLCRTCGQDFVKVRFEPDQPEQTVANDDFLSDENTRFITPRLVGERPDADDETEDNDSEEEEPRPRRRRQTAAEKRLKQQYVDHVRGRVFDTEPDGVPKENLSRQHVLSGRGTTCPVCNSRYTRGDVLTLLRTGVASSVSVLGTHHQDRVPENERKLLIFADNRQDAAHQAGYMSDRHRQFALRHAIEAAVSEAGASGIALQDLPNRVREIFQRIGLAKRNLTRDEEMSWRRTLEYEIAAEFCRATQQRIALENLALVEVQYEFLDKLVATVGSSNAAAAPDQTSSGAWCLCGRCSILCGAGVPYPSTSINPSSIPREPPGAGLPSSLTTFRLPNMSAAQSISCSIGLKRSVARRSRASSWSRSSRTRNAALRAESPGSSATKRASAR